MPGGNQNATRGVLRSSAASGAAVVLAISAFVAQSPQLVIAAGRGCVTPGNAGPAATLTGIVNAYYPANAGAAAGATSISLGSALAAGSLTAIAAGSLLLVIQMQDADINSSNTIAYGDGSTGRGLTAVRSTGLYEYAVATNGVPVGGGTVNIAGTGAGGGLVNSY